VNAWIVRNALPVERCMQVLADVRAGTSDLATLSVAVREIRNLIEATPPAARVESEFLGSARSEGTPAKSV
jgi:hypothetical protein